MIKAQLNTIFLFFIIIVVGIGAYQVFKPFILPVLLAFILSQFFNGWYQKIYQKFKKREAISSLATCFLVFLIFVIPLVIIITIIVAQASSLYQELEQNHWNEKATVFLENPTIQKLDLKFNKIDFQKLILGEEKFAQGLKEVSGISLKIIKNTYQSASQFIFMTFIMFFSLYYFFKDQKIILKKLMNLIPLKNQAEKLLIDKFVNISRSTLKGSLVIALIQGGLITLAFWGLGVSAPAFWGLITSVLSLIPMLGSGIIWLPGSIMLFITGETWQGIFLLLFGAIVISNIDNVLRPKLVGNEARLHPLLVFFSTLGGIGVFGIMGFLLGPIIIVLFLTLLEIYEIEFKQELKKFNG